MTHPPIWQLRLIQLCLLPPLAVTIAAYAAFTGSIGLVLAFISLMLGGDGAPPVWRHVSDNSLTRAFGAVWRAKGGNSKPPPDSPYMAPPLMSNALAGRQMESVLRSRLHQQQPLHPTNGPQSCPDPWVEAQMRFREEELAMQKKFAVEPKYRLYGYANCQETPIGKFSTDTLAMIECYKQGSSATNIFEWFTIEGPDGYLWKSKPTN